MNDIEFLKSENSKKPVDPPPPLISGYIDGHRVMPPATPFPGFWENERTPYLDEIMDNMSPFSPIITTSAMKGAQLGLTAAAENVIGYWMDANPAEILYVSATDELLEKWATKRLEPLIDSIGMREKIYAQAEVGAKSRRTGDKVYSKHFTGGALDMASAQSASGLRSDSKRILVLDEIDGAPRQLKTGEGDWIKVAKGRTNAWGPRKKILEFSTPTTYDGSLIRDRYEAGDQRKYFVKLPCCGKLDTLEFHNLKHEMRGGILYRVWYECPHCSGKIQNHQKTVMMSAASGAKWKPTAKASTRNHRSYHISSLYSPVGMMSWYELYEEYLDCKDDPEKMRSFVNLYLGLPYKETGSRPSLEKVIALRGEYREREVPDGVLYITASVDVQRGSEKDPANPPRLEMEVVGHGAKFRTWSLLYKVFIGDTTTSSFDGAWEDMHQWAENGGLTFERSDGAKFPTSLVFIDSGDGVYMDIVFAFTRRWDNTYPSKGFSALMKKKKEKGDEAGPHNFKRYRAARSARQGDTEFYEISTNYYKTNIYNNLKIERQDFDPQRPGFCDFPRERNERYFKMLTAEEKRRDGSFHAGGRRNEALDCRVMNLCAGDVYLDSKVRSMQLAAKANGASDVEIASINHLFVLEVLTRRTQRRVVA